MTTRRAAAGILAIFVSAGLAATARARQAAPDLAPQVDRVFEKWTAATPGCAVGVAVGGQTVVARAYGMADLEHDVRNTPETIFEAGSVSKQFTAAAILLLAREGLIADRRQDFEHGRKDAESDVEPHLVVPRAGRAVRQRFRADLQAVQRAALRLNHALGRDAQRVQVAAERIAGDQVAQVVVE